MIADKIVCLFPRTTQTQTEQFRKRTRSQIIVSAPSRKSPLPTASLAPMPSIGGGRKGAVAARGAGGTGADAGGSGQGGDHGANSDEGPVREVDLVRIGTIVKDRRTVQDIEEEARQSKRRRGF